MDAHDGSVLSSIPKQVGSMLLSGDTLSEGLEKFRDHELEDEIQDLIDDQVYNDFLVEIAKDKPVKESPNEDGDLEFSPKKNVTDVEAETNVAQVGDAMSFNDAISTSSESDTSVLDENEGEATKPYDKLSEVSPDELEMIKNHVPVAVPKNSLKATQNRFPPFWRVKHAIRNVGENDGYNSGEDADYLPQNVDEEEDEVSPIGEQEIPSNMKDQNDSSGMSYQSSDDEKSESEELDKEVKDLQEMPDIQQDLKGLAEMVVEMSVIGNHASNQPTLENAHGACNNDMEEGNLSFSPVNFVESIIQFNDDDYKEEADNDYDPIADEANIEETNPNDVHSEENGRNSDESSSSDSEGSNSADSEGSNSGDSDKA